MPPLVTVIMPVYNSVNTVEQSLNSALHQTVSDIELYIIDDGSVDRTLEVLTEIEKRDLRVTVIRNDCNIGVAESRNRGINLAVGKYIAFLDGDDIWAEDKLEKQIALLEETGGDLCFTSYEYIDSVGVPIRRGPYIVPLRTSYTDMLRENVICISTVLLKRDALRGIRFKGQWFHEDYVLWLELLRAGKTTCGLNEVLVTYRIGGRSTDKLNAAKYRWKVYREYAKLSLTKSLYFFCCYTYNGLKKSLKHKRKLWGFG